MNKYCIEFNSNQLYNWLDRKFGLGEDYRELFQVHHINGCSFLNVDPKLFKEIGINSIGVRVKFLRVITKQRRLHNIVFLI